MIDWYRVLRSEARGDLIKTWGLITAPGPLHARVAQLPPKKTLDETFGFDYMAR